MRDLPLWLHLLLPMLAVTGLVLCRFRPGGRAAPGGASPAGECTGETC